MAVSYCPKAADGCGFGEFFTGAVARVRAGAQGRSEHLTNGGLGPLLAGR